MLKKILIGLGIFVLIVAAALVYLNHRNRTLSPPGSAEMSAGELTVKIEYSRPSVRDRLVFGEESEGALQPYGVYWRLGANEPTRLTVNKDFKIEGNSLKAGTYDLYAVPGKEEFKIGVNTGDRFWGVTEPDYSEDIANFNVPAVISDISVEQFTITPVAEDGGINLVFMWSDRMWEVLITE